MSSAIVAGKYKNYEEAAQYMVKIKTKIEPNNDLKEIYEKKFNNYCAIVDTLDNVWERLL